MRVEVPVPSPADDGLLVKIHAAGGESSQARTAPAQGSIPMVVKSILLSDLNFGESVS